MSPAYNSKEKPSAAVDFEQTLLGDEPQNHGALIIRDVLSNRLMDNERVRAVFDEHARKGELLVTAQALRAAIDEAAEACGIAAADLAEKLFECQEDVVSMESAPKNRALARRKLSLVTARVREYDRALDSMVRVTDDIIPLLKSWGLSYPCLVVDLTFGFFLYLQRIAFGLPFIGHWQVGYDLPTMESFQALEGESLRQTYDRFCDEYQSAKAAMKTKSRMPKGRGENLRRYAEWLYLNQVEGKSKNSIAKSHALFGCSADRCGMDHRPEVQHGIRRAQALLRLHSIQPLQK